MHVIAKGSMATHTEGTSIVLREIDRNGMSTEELVNSV